MKWKKVLRVLGAGEKGNFRGKNHCTIEWGRVNLEVPTKNENIEPLTNDIAEQNSQEAVFRTDIKDLPEEMDNKLS